MAPEHSFANRFQCKQHTSFFVKSFVNDCSFRSDFDGLNGKIRQSYILENTLWGFRKFIRNSYFKLLCFGTVVLAYVLTVFPLSICFEIFRLWWRFFLYTVLFYPKNQGYNLLSKSVFFQDRSKTFFGKWNFDDFATKVLKTHWEVVEIIFLSIQLIGLCSTVSLRRFVLFAKL